MKEQSKKLTQPPTGLKLNDLAGQWYIHFSDFPMWLKGDKRFPIFNYAPGKRAGTTGLHDTVQYMKNGKQKTIVGFDTPTDASNSAYVWRGKGLLSLLKSTWEILYVEPNQQWAIIHFQKTLFTPIGYDVIGRKRQLNEDQRQRTARQLAALGIKSSLTPINQLTGEEI